MHATYPHCVCYPHVVEDGQDVSDGAAVDVLEVVIASLGKDQSVALLLRKKILKEASVNRFHLI